MDPGYARSYRDLYEKHWWWRAREDLILATLEQLRPGGGWGRILDVGCGDGLLFERLDALGQVEGIETDPAAVTPGSRWASRIHRRAFDEGFRPSAPYSLVLLLDVLEHLADPRSYLRRAVELLEPSGSILITVPAFPLLWTSHDVLNRHFVRYTRSSLASLARACGADLLYSRYFFQWLAPVKLAAHFGEAFARKEPATPRVPARPVNDFLYRLSRAEQRLLRRVPVPFGSSLLAVAGPSRAGS
ncbi:MAG TPA: class I SAM-dependent methyltransferase [Thermoanaerobaculia bacterium]|nr:class I SAM-dependent methyltransferase [Thermoanaerobaculia bacterium]